MGLRITLCKKMVRGLSLLGIVLFFFFFYFTSFHFIGILSRPSIQYVEGKFDSICFVFCKQKFKDVIHLFGKHLIIADFLTLERPGGSN